MWQALSLQGKQRGLVRKIEIDEQELAVNYPGLFKRTF
jgi:hypothetical protein